MSQCDVCFRKCDIPEGQTGFCGARACRGGQVVPENYGRITAIALDPIEKKPLSRFYPRSMILSVGSCGCNLRCPFCQNHDISWSKIAPGLCHGAAYMPPEELVRIAGEHRGSGNIGVAFTYNEPLIGYEYVRDTARLVKEAGMKNVMVTNGTASIRVLEELLPCIDAMNIDIKGFSEDYYDRLLGGSMKMTMDFITRAVRDCHVELTTLIVTGENDSEDEMERMTEWIAAINPDIPLHVSRFFPRFNMTDRDATDVGLVYRLADIAKRRLNHVYTGNC